jgi:hypothetical protein
MNVSLSSSHLTVELTLPEKIGALRGDLRIPRERIVEARVDAQPLQSIRSHRLKVGLRVPGRLFVCHTDRLRHFWAVRSGVPAVDLLLAGGRRVTASTPDAERVVAELATPSH